MIKFSLLLLTAYVLYYAGNIIYDLFLKKETTPQQEESEVFSLSDLTDKRENPAMVDIEDVETLNMPKSFTRKEINPKLSSEHEERLSLDELRQRFESEQDLDDASEEETEKKNEAVKEKDSGWQNILSLSETMVQLVSNIDGHKVYHSTM
ncbi:hypothetical protein [Chryseobacterium sp. EO14]|uniref:hypothetical protein n=1 Tax=Chryseobacterium sp. EO14 TaxID=2950551 RepID=UPI00210DDA7B|nr:hypothetical protein [Chryseobacterium sp. EO14]MCQ4139510.1 hypothetical protein [Chryseobacterium sp. EO14]